MAAGWLPMTPTSVTYTGTGASISGYNVNATAITTLIINGVFSSSYNFYKVFISGKSASGINNLEFRLSVGGVTAATDYDFSRLNNVGGGFSVAAVANRASFIAATIAPESIGSEVVVVDPAAASPTRLSMRNAFYDSGDCDFYWPAAAHQISTAYDGFEVYTTGGDSFTGDIVVIGANF